MGTAALNSPTWPKTSRVRKEAPQTFQKGIWKVRRQSGWVLALHSHISFTKENALGRESIPMHNRCFQDLFLKKKIQSCLWDQSSSSNSQQVMGEGQNQVEKSVKLDLISSPPTNKNRRNRLQNKTDFQGSSKQMLITGNGKCTGLPCCLDLLPGSKQEHLRL